MRVGLVQMTSGENVTDNLQSMLQAIDELAAQKVDLISFPENSLYMRVQPHVELPKISLQDKAIAQLEQKAKSYGIALHIGSLPFDDKGVRRNTSLIVEPGKSAQAVYHKIHLFDVDLKNQKPIRESDVFQHGVDPYVWEYKSFKIGMSICYDMRFSELYYRYAKMGAEVLLIPAAFTVPTGQAHWHLLLRARAVECQAYVLAAAQGGIHRVQGAERATYGHTLAVDPWGVVIAEIIGEAEVPTTRWIVTELSKQRLQEVRSQIPMSSHRRL